MVTRAEIVVFELLEVLKRSADAEYFGDPVSRLDLAAPENAPRMGDVGVVSHESIGADFLAARGFSETVVALVRGHVAAKRHLARINARYLAQLSAASLETLSHQGGPMSREEVEKFERDPLHAAHLRQRSWDEQAKRAGWNVPRLEHYRPLLERHLELLLHGK